MRKAHFVSGVEMSGHRVGGGTGGQGGSESCCRYLVLQWWSFQGALQLSTGHQHLVQHQAWEQWDSVRLKQEASSFLSENPKSEKML